MGITVQVGDMDTLLTEVIKGIPSFAGLVFLALVLREINQKQWQVIERVLEKCERLTTQIDDLAHSVKALSKPE